MLGSGCRRTTRHPLLDCAWLNVGRPPEPTWLPMAYACRCFAWHAPLPLAEPTATNGVASAGVTSRCSLLDADAVTAACLRASLLLPNILARRSHLLFIPRLARVLASFQPLSAIIRSRMSNICSTMEIHVTRNSFGRNNGFHLHSKNTEKKNPPMQCHFRYAKRATSTRAACTQHLPISIPAR